MNIIPYLVYNGAPPFYSNDAHFNKVKVNTIT